VREFTMKDSYSFDLDPAGLDLQFDRHFAAYSRIFERIGVTAIAVEASSGAMGGSDSVEFMVPSAAGEDDVAYCPACDYAANVERATSTIPRVDDDPWPGEAERFPTPGVRTIADLVDFEGGADADRQIKTLVYILDGEPALVLLRGDHELHEQKLQDGTGAIEIRPAHAEEIRDLLGADAGSLGAVGVDDLRILADLQLAERVNMVTGANLDDHHLRGVDVGRDIAVSEWLDLRSVVAGEGCPVCGEPLDLFRGIEAGHIFKLGTKFSDALGATVLDAAGMPVPIVMGSYGIGVERNLAAAVEMNHDEQGIIWPVAIAPYEVVITVVKTNDADTMTVANRLYEDLTSAGVDVLIDDRAERPGVKFVDAELIGIPFRVTVGPKGLADGVVEFSVRRTSQKSEIGIEDAANEIAARVVSSR
jgi:prolyl-tRNA synthetase